MSELSYTGYTKPSSLAGFITGCALIVVFGLGVHGFSMWMFDDPPPPPEEGSAVMCDFLCLSVGDGTNKCDWLCEDPQLEVACNNCEYLCRDGSCMFTCVQCDVGTY